MKALKVAASVLISIVLCSCLIALAIFFGVRYGGFKGDTVEDVLNNANVYDAFGETTREVLIVHFANDEFKKGLIACIPEKMISDMSKEIVRAVSNNDKVNLKNTLKSSEEFTTNATNYIYDVTFEELNKHETLDANLVRSFPVMNRIKDTLDIDMAEMVIVALDLESTPIATKDVATPEMLQLLKDYTTEPLAHAAAYYIKDNTDKINDIFNQELSNNSRFGDIYKIVDLANYALSMSVLTGAIMIFICMVLAFLILLIFWRNKSTGLRTIGIDLIVSGIFSILIVIGLEAGRHINSGIIKTYSGLSLEKTLVLIRELCSNIMLPVSICSGIFIILGFILAIISNATKNRKNHY